MPCAFIFINIKCCRGTDSTPCLFMPSVASLMDAPFQALRRSLVSAPCKGVLRQALAQIHQDQPQLTRACSRLDAGVSAKGLVVSCPLSRDWSPAALGKALNSHLPEDLRISQVAPMSDDFDALQMPSRKTYHYQIWCAPAARPTHAMGLAPHLATTADWWQCECDESDKEVE